MAQALAARDATTASERLAGAVTEAAKDASLHASAMQAMTDACAMLGITSGRAGEVLGTDAESLAATRSRVAELVDALRLQRG